MEPPSAEHDDAAEELARHVAEAVPDASGPVEVLAAARDEGGTTAYEISASRLVAVDADDPALSDVFVAVPVTGHVTLAADGSIVADLAPVDEATSGEVRAWARSLLATGSIEGLPAAAPTFGPRRRPTHQLVEDANGRRVLRRIGFAASLSAAPPPAGEADPA